MSLNRFSCTVLLGSFLNNFSAVELFLTLIYSLLLKSKSSCLSTVTSSLNPNNKNVRKRVFFNTIVLILRSGKFLYIVITNGSYFHTVNGKFGGCFVLR